MDYESERRLGYKRRPRFKALVWGDGSVSKEFAIQTCLPESVSTVHKESRHRNVCSASQCGGRQEDIGGSLASLARSVSPRDGDRPCLPKIRWRNNLGDRHRCQPLTSTCTWTSPYMCTHRRTQTHIHNTHTCQYQLPLSAECCLV